MKRFAFPILFLIVLITPFALRAAMRVSTASIDTSNAQKLVIISPHVEGIRREFADAFSAYHKKKFGQDVVVEYRNYGGTADIVKYFENSRALFNAQGTFEIDLIWGGGDDQFNQQFRPFLQPLDLPADVIKTAFPTPDINGVPLYDKEKPPVWFGTALSSFGIVYNKDVLKHLGVPEPTTWRDLQDPRYRGWLVMADPTKSTSAKSAFMIVVERAMADAQEQGRSMDVGWAEGMGLVRTISSNARMFTDSGASVPNFIGNGDAAAGMAIDFYAKSQVEAIGSDRMGYIEPVGATIINPDPIGLVKGAQHVEVARRFVEFVLSDAGQRLWITRAGVPGGPRSTSLRRLPIVRGVYDDPRDFSDTANPFKNAGSFNLSPARRGTFRILGELIAMSCMDLLPELRETRKVVLDSPRAAELNAKLSIFPFDQQEALARSSKLSKASPLDRLELERQWTQEFRDEYADLQREARKR